MSVTTVDSPLICVETTPLEAVSPSGLAEKIEHYTSRLLALARLRLSSEDTGDARQTIEGVLRAQRDELVRTTLTLREPPIA